MPRQPRTCKQCGIRPVRKRRGASFCSPCVAKLTKVVCADCGQSVAPDMASTKTRCKVCASKGAHEKRVSETYGLKPGQYQQLLDHQGGVCYICHRKPGAKRLACDHDHACCPGPVSCGKCVRGLLCRSCNRDVLGHLKDDPAALQRAIDYLTTPPAKAVLWPVR